MAIAEEKKTTNTNRVCGDRKSGRPFFGEKKERKKQKKRKKKKRKEIRETKGWETTQAV